MIRRAENIILKKRLLKQSGKLKRQNKRIRWRENENRNLKIVMQRTARKNGDTQECSWQQNTAKS